MNRGRDYFGNGWSMGLANELSTPFYFHNSLVLTSPTLTVPTATGTTGVSTNTWYYAVGSWNTSTGAVKIYVNGQLEATTTTGANTLRSSTAGWTLGSISNLYYFDCHVASTQLYSNALSDSDVLQNFNATKTRFGY